MAEQGILTDRVVEHVHRNGRSVRSSEKTSWSPSLSALGRDLLDAGLGDIEMIVEFALPLTSKRVDVILAGKHPESGTDSYLVVELKQWSRARLFDGLPTVVKLDHVPEPLAHPVLQVSGYCEYMIDFLAVLSGAPERLRGVAYLHNATDDGVRELLANPLGEQDRFLMFTGQHRDEFRAYLRGLFVPESGVEAARRLETSAVRPSANLLSRAADVLTQRAHFPLLDEQRAAYEMVLGKVEEARQQNSKRVIVVAGGPGSGKSVVALSVFAEVAGRGYEVLHATGSSAFTHTMRKYAARALKRVEEVFKFFYTFATEEPNRVEVLLCDEAHRIREHSVIQWMTKEAREKARESRQLDELIAAARVPVFLLDEHQVVRPGETGTVDIIRERTKELGLEFRYVPLRGQFRCGGSDAYERWVVNLLGLEDLEPSAWQGDKRFDLKLADTPADMETYLIARLREGRSARISAGFCWPWSKPLRDGTLVDDVQIGDWRRPWNANSAKGVGGAPGKAYWATDPAGFGQVGCVYTAQGFEYDWAGVIIGPDLVARDGTLVTQRRESKDRELKPRKVTDEQTDRFIRNTYKVLLTRAMRGAVIYATDEETREYLSGLVRDHVPAAPPTSDNG